MREFFSENKWPLLVAVAAILVRLIYLTEISRQPGFFMLMVDEQWHWLWAQEIVEKSFWGDGSYFRGPLYPYFLAFLYLVTGGSILWAKIFQLILCGFSACLIFKLADSLFGKRAGIVAGFIYALYGTLVFYESMLLIPVLFLPLTLWGMYRLIIHQDNRSISNWIFTGVIFGLAALARPNILFVVPFLAIWLFMRHLKFTDNTIEAVKPALVWVVGLFIAIAPVTIRNIAVTGDFVLISTQGGVNLYLGNNEYADGLMMIMPEVELDNTVSWDMFVPLTNSAAEREAGKKLSEAEISDFWSGKAVAFMVNNPGKFAKLVWKKTVYLLSGFENSDAADIYFQRTKSSLYSVLVWDKLISFPFGLLFPLFLISIIVLRNDFQKLLPLYIFIVTYTPTIILFLVTARHRLPLVPFLIVIASGGIIRLFQTFKQYSLFQKSVITVSFLAALLIFNQKYYDLGEPNPFFIHYNEGLQYHRLGEFEKAEAEYLKAKAAFPFSAALLVNLGEVQLKLNKIDEADRNLVQAISIKPEYAMSYNDLGVVVKRKGNLDSAAVLFHKAIQLYNPNAARPNEIGDYYVNLADTYKIQGKYDSAAEAFHQAMTRSPLMPEAFYQSALFFAERKMFDISDSLYKAAAHIKQADASENYNWGMSLIERERYEEGVSYMRRALKKDDKFYRAWYVIAAVYNRFGEPPDSVDFYLQKCLAVEPNFEPAVKLKQTIQGK